MFYLPTYLTKLYRIEVQQINNFLRMASWRGLKPWTSHTQREPRVASTFMPWKDINPEPKEDAQLIEPQHDKSNKTTCLIWSESSQCAQWVAEDPMFLHADSEDSDQTGRMPRLIWVFTGRKGHFVGFFHKEAHFIHTLLYSDQKF